MRRQFLSDIELTTLHVQKLLEFCMRLEDELPSDMMKIVERHREIFCDNLYERKQIYER